MNPNNRYHEDRAVAYKHEKAKGTFQSVLSIKRAMELQVLWTRLGRTAIGRFYCVAVDKRLDRGSPHT